MQGIYNHVTARVSQDTEHFLLNPFGKKKIYASKHYYLHLIKYTL